MRPGDTVVLVARPTFSGTMRARQSKKDGHGVTTQQWLGYIAVAALTTWLTKKLDDLVEQRLGEGMP
jgi:hypothetical protein